MRDIRLHEVPGALLLAGKCLLRADQWLGGAASDRPSRSEFRSLARARLARVLDEGRPGGLPRAIRTVVGTRAYYLRQYRLRDIYEALIALWASHTAPSLGLVAPAMFQRALVWLRGRPYYVLLQEEIKGQHFPQWTPGLAADTARGLAAWHATPLGDSKQIMGLFPRTPLHYAHRLRGLQGSALPEPVRSSAGLALEWLGDPRFVGASSVCHADLRGANLLAIAPERIGWLDLDAIRFRPIRHDLAQVAFAMAGQEPATLAAFEAAYFRERPDQEAGWREHRLRWLAFFCLVEGATYADRRDTRLSDSDYRRAAARVAQALVCLQTKDKGQSTHELLREIQARGRAMQASILP